MKKITKCPKCGGELLIWKRLDVTRTYKGKMTIEEVENKTLDRGCKCEDCSWSVTVDFVG